MTREDLEKHMLSNITVSKKKGRDYSKDPAFIKQKEEAIAFLKKYGAPKWYKHKIN